MRNKLAGIVLTGLVATVALACGNGDKAYLDVTYDTLTDAHKCDLGEAMPRNINADVTEQYQLYLNIRRELLTYCDNLEAEK